MRFTPGYKEYIKSPQWKLVCQKYWALYGRKCQACGARRNLHVHHKTYDRFGRESLADLCGLCYDCHKAVHAAHRSNRSLTLKLVTERYIVQKRMGK